MRFYLNLPADGFAAKMLVAYYSKGADVRDLFENLKKIRYNRSNKRRGTP